MKELRFPLARYCFEFEVTRPLRLPEYAGSALRGAFGSALRGLACVTRAKSCEGCLVRTTCPYATVFEPPAAASAPLGITTPPVPYIVEPPEWGAREYHPGDLLTFRFTLVGRAVEHLPLCLMAWMRAFARGVGAGDGTAELLAVIHELPGQAVVIYRSGEQITPHDQHIEFPGEIAPPAVVLDFSSPLRLQGNGRALPPWKLTPRPLLTALVRRASLLSQYYGEGALYSESQFSSLGKAAETIAGNHNMQWHDWTRRSSRQSRTMQLGGAMGSWRLEGDLVPFWDAIRLGEWLHVGKEASFGLGKYRIAAT